MNAAVDENVAVSLSGAVAEVTFGAAPNNHISLNLATLLADAFAELDEEPRCRAIVLRSEGRVFCGGADLQATSDESRGAATERLYEQAVRLFGTRKPIVAAVQGAAIGAGLGLALVADFRIAAPEARFAANFVRLGFHPGFGITHSLPRLVGAQQAARMLLTGDRLSGEDAHLVGLVDEVAALGELVDRTRELAAAIAQNAPLAVEATRATLRAGLAAAIGEATAHERGEQMKLMSTSDFAEGVRAVAERRPGSFNRT